MITCAGSLTDVMRRVLLVLLSILLARCGSAPPPGLAAGTPAPDFSLPGVDGRTHTLEEYAGSRILAIVLTSNTCPASLLAEAQLRQVTERFGTEVALVAVNPNTPAAMTLADLSYSDVGESLEEMKIRARHRQLPYPYLSDPAHTLTKALEATTVPHAFVFDPARTLHYQGHVEGAFAAIDTLAGNRGVAAARRDVAGCPIKGPEPVKDAELAAIDASPTGVTAIDADGLKTLRQNGTGKLLLINFWATWCAPCVAEFPELQRTYRMYKRRNVELIAVSVNDPAERPAVEEFLKQQRATHVNRQFATADVYGLQAAFDPKMPAPVPFSLLLAPNGDVLYQELGAANIPRLRRAILANLEDDRSHPGVQAYWSK